MGPSDILWYCDNCGDGPIQDWSPSCNNCGHKRGSCCRTESFGDLSLTALYPTPSLVPLVPLKKSSNKKFDAPPTSSDDGAARFRAGPASPRSSQNIVIDHSPVPDVGKYSEKAQFPIHDLPAEHQEREESYQAIEHVAPIKPGSAAVPDDSGYASQSRMDDSISSRSYIEAHPLAVEPVEEAIADNVHLPQFRNLLPSPHMRRVLNTTPKSQIWLSREQNNSLNNRMKSCIEDYTQLEWDWWPLEPRMRTLRDDETRLFWICVCGSRLWTEISNEEAKLVHEILRETQLGSPIQSALPTSSASQRYALRSQTPLSPATGSGPSSNNAAQPNTTSQNVPQHLGGSTLISQPTANATAASSPGPLWVLFGVQGPRKSLGMEHIAVDSATNDDAFYRSLRKYYRIHRGRLRLWLSFWRFQYCNVVKFKRLAPNWVIRVHKDLPSDQEYIYQPRPPIATNPPIPKHEFEMHLSACDSRCRWSWSPLHECMPQLHTCTSINSIPKRSKRFDTINTAVSNQPSDVFAWGLEARHTISALYVLVYHVLILAGPFAFWAWWAKEHPGDLQNASVPMTVVMVLLSLFWSTNGILTEGREGKEA